MKVLFFLSLVFTSLFFQTETKITITPDKKVYTQGEIITFKVKSNKRFQLATDGSCSSSILPPRFVMERNGKFPLPEAMVQMCCGLPCAGPYKNYEFTNIEPLAIGRWKVMLFTCDFKAGTVESEVFEVVE